MVVFHHVDRMAHRAERQTRLRQVLLLGTGHPLDRRKQDLLFLHHVRFEVGGHLPEYLGNRYHFRIRMAMDSGYLGGEFLQQRDVFSHVAMMDREDVLHQQSWIPRVEVRRLRRPIGLFYLEEFALQGAIAKSFLFADLFDGSPSAAAEVNAEAFKNFGFPIIGGD